MFLSKVAFARNPMVFINSDKSSEDPAFKIVFTWFKSRAGIC